jgi:hypothetical protein
MQFLVGILNVIIICWSIHILEASAFMKLLGIFMLLLALHCCFCSVRKCHLISDHVVNVIMFDQVCCLMQMPDVERDVHVWSALDMLS